MQTRPSCSDIFLHCATNKQFSMIKMNMHGSLFITLALCSPAGHAKHLSAVSARPALLKVQRGQEKDDAYLRTRWKERGEQWKMLS